MEELFGTLLILAVVGGLGFFAWEQRDFAKAQIAGELLRLHATRIEIAEVWADSSRESLAYDVEYTTPDGVRHANSCRVLKSTAGVAWAKPLTGAAS